jgi:hypothetical protein
VLLIARVQDAADSTSWLPACRRRLVVITPHQFLLLRRQGLKGVLRGRYPLVCELRLQMGGIKRVILADGEGPRFSLSTESVGEIALKSAEAKNIVDVLQKARHRQHLQSAGTFRIDITDLETHPCLEGCEARPAEDSCDPIPERLPHGSTLKQRKSVISTGHNFDRLRRSSQRKLFETASGDAACHPAAIAAGLVKEDGSLSQSPSTSALHLVVSKQAPGGEGRRIGAGRQGSVRGHVRSSTQPHECNGNTMQFLPATPVREQVQASAQGTPRTAGIMSRRKSVISTAESFERCRGSSTAVRSDNPTPGRTKSCSSTVLGSQGAVASFAVPSDQRPAAGSVVPNVLGRSSISVEALSAGAVISHLRDSEHASSRCVLLEGLLLKQRQSGIHKMRSWHRRYFRLSPEVLTYSAEARAGGGAGLGCAATPERSVNLVDIIRVEMVRGEGEAAEGDASGSKPAVVLHMSGLRRLKMRAAGAEAGEAARWYAAVRQAHKRLALAQIAPSDIETRALEIMDIGDDVLAAKADAHVAQLLALEQSGDDIAKVRSDAGAASPLAFACSHAGDARGQLARLDALLKSMQHVLEHVRTHAGQPSEGVGGGREEERLSTGHEELMQLVFNLVARQQRAGALPRRQSVRTRSPPRYG